MEEIKTDFKNINKKIFKIRNFYFEKILRAFKYLEISPEIAFLLLKACYLKL